MGNNHSHDGTPKGSISRNNSGGDLQDKVPSQLLPIDKLAKLLVQKSLEEDSLQNGISLRIFTLYLFPKYPDMAKNLYQSFLKTSNCCNGVITQAIFCSQSEKYLGIMVDEQMILTYVSMFAEGSDSINQNQFRELLMTVFKIAMDHYPEGPKFCPHINKTLKAVVDSAFHKKEILTTCYLTHWIQQHLPKSLILLHRFVAHILSTAYRSVAEKINEKDQGLELTTPILDKISPDWEVPDAILPLSQVWILSTSLPSLYTKPSQQSPSSSTNGFTSKTFIAKLLDFSCPSHWTPLYNSNHHGIGANRFLHHVLSYRGPTLMFIEGDQGMIFCIGSNQEWKDTHQYWGGEESIIVQMLPLYSVVERGAKLIYLNSSIRGYPKGIRAGLDPRKPKIEINEGFSEVKFQGVPYNLHSIEVWGCGTPQSREVQLDIKKWQVKQIEKERTVKLSASDWVDHPDRYLLELAGRPNYSQSNGNN
uniref:TLDc domain-containing protein n=1 Tax=Clastoptera arizonana TaxID=38151 RepID=A0A1B6DBB8_9HEMI